MYTSKRIRQASGRRREVDERYTKLRVKNKNLVPLLLSDRFIPTILRNSLILKSEACKRKQREDTRAGKG
jgi:hypothetical protein